MRTATCAIASLMLAVSACPQAGVLSPITRATVANEYRYSTGFSGMTLQLLPNGKFVAEFVGDVIYPGKPRTTITRGRWTIESQLVIVRYPKRKETYIPIEWGKAMYLIPTDHKQAFVAFANEWRAKVRKDKNYIAGLGSSFLASGWPNVLGSIRVPATFQKHFSGIK